MKSKKQTREIFDFSRISLKLRRNISRHPSPDIETPWAKYSKRYRHTRPPSIPWHIQKSRPLHMISQTTPTHLRKYTPPTTDIPGTPWTEEGQEFRGNISRDIWWNIWWNLGEIVSGGWNPARWSGPFFGLFSWSNLTKFPAYFRHESETSSRRILMGKRGRKGSPTVDEIRRIWRPPKGPNFGPFFQEKKWADFGFHQNFTKISLKFH